MKNLLVFISMFVATSAFATEKKCSVIQNENGKRIENVVVLTPEVKEGLDLASYVYRDTIGNIDVQVVEVDGNYFATMKHGAYSVSAQGEDKIELSFRRGNFVIDLMCY